jgi:saposin
MAPQVPEVALKAPVQGLKVGQSTECVVCEFAMMVLKKLISTNASEVEVIAALEMVCDILPRTLSVPCHSLIEVYGKQILDLIVAGMDASEICTAIGLCDPPSVSVKGAPSVSVKGATTVLPSRSTRTLAGPDPQTCAVCETVVQYLETMLETNATMAQIEALLQTVCSAIPSLKQQCDAFVQKYEAQIIHYVSTLASPKEVCTLIGVCADKRADDEVKEVKQTVKLLGENECSWGPSYWCQNRHTAEQCKAVDHCKKYVWNK